MPRRTFGYARARSGGARRRDHPSRRSRPARITGRSPPPSISARTRPALRARSRAVSDYRVVGQNAPRARPRRQGVRRARLCPRHGARRHGACARRAPAAPRRDDRDDRRGRDPARRARADRDRPRRQFPRDPRRRRDGRRSRRRGRAGLMSTWDGVDAINPFQEEARWLLQQPSIDRTIGAAAADPTPRGAALRGDLYPRCTSPTPRSRRPAGSLSTATGSSRCGRIRRASTRCALRWRGP